MAQGIHRMDMRLRLGLLRDTAAAEKRTSAEAAARRHKPTSPTVKTEAESKAQQAADDKAKAAAASASKPPPKYHIRPLSESKAIESGATFISEGFLFLVAGGLIVFESWRSRRKETSRREDVASRLVDLEQAEKSSRRALVTLEKELLQVRAKHGESLKPGTRILPQDIRELEEEEEEEEAKEEGLWSRISAYVSPYFSFDQSTSRPADLVREDRPSHADGNSSAGEQPPSTTQSPNKKPSESSGP